jgi:isoquinoline 1-oxidoreductase beta subunit
LPSRVARGIALGEPFGSRLCAIVEVEVTAQGEVRLRRAVVALDCGVGVNPSSIEAQIQGGLLFGLSAALYSEVTIKDGVIEQSNFNDYRVLRINETPLIEVHRIENFEAPGGLGETGTAIAAPALANAIFAATGVRLYKLPVDRALLVQDADALKNVVAAATTRRGRNEA